MGQILRILSDASKYNYDYYYSNNNANRDNVNETANALPDLSEWPPELSLTVLKHLNATDLCLASCVWRSLACDEVLWHSLSRSQWAYASIYGKPKNSNFSYHRLYLQLDEGSVTFNADAEMGMRYFFKYELVDNNPVEIAKFFHSAKPLDKRQMRLYLCDKPHILEHLVNLENFQNQFLAHALRRFFTILEAPNKRDNYLHLMLEKFSQRFCKCNPNLGLNSDMIYILCFSLIMLSVDLCSPHVKNKMSKREFIRNVRHAIHYTVSDELYGHLYDDIYVKGHIAHTNRCVRATQTRFSH